MNTKRCKFMMALTVGFCFALPALGEDEHGGDLAEKATNPVAALVQLQFQNNAIIDSEAGDGYSNAFVVQPVIPWKLGKLQMLSRYTLPLVVRTPDLGGDIGNEHGTGDTVLLNANTHSVGSGRWKAMIGPVVTFTLPTGSSDFTTAGKYQAGPGFVYLNLGTKGLQWGVFGYQQWSFADGTTDEVRPEVSKLFFQPIVTKHFSKGRYIALQDILWSVDWKNDNNWALPTGLRFGKVTAWGKQKVNLFVEPWYDVSGENTGNEWGVKLNLTLLFPK